jgi:predicted NBD/HSP70 family sugar kinase
VQEAAGHPAAGLVGIVNALNPCLLILGAGVIEGFSGLLQMVEARVRASALQTNVEGLSFAGAALGDKVGVIGAAAFARRASQ